MDTFFSSILGELASRSLSFLVERCSKPPPSKEEKIKKLERILLRLAIAIEEAEGRRITNHAMLRQVNMLRQDMHRGHYVLDTFRIQKADDEEDDDQVSSSLALSKFTPTAKRFRFPTGSNRRHGDKGELEGVLDNLGVATADLVEFVLLLKNYPSIHHQPYNTYMFMGKCMFGRQMEMEQVINFLLLVEPESTAPSVDKLGILPIIGPSNVGKSTLVEHVCNDERVRNHFSRIIFLSDKDFREEKSLLTFTRDEGVIRHKHGSSSLASNGERLLIVVELAEDFDDDKWRRMYASSQSCISAGTKIIITSRSEKIAKLGTTRPLHLKFLPREAYWYFFKVLAFGSSDPKEHPELASVSLALFNCYFDHEMYNNFIGPFIELSNIASFIQATTVYWGSCPGGLRERIMAINEVRKYFLLSRGSNNLELKRKCILVPWLDETVRYYYCEIYSRCRVGLDHGEEEAVPKIELQDLMSGRVAPHGKFDLVLWRSPLPPYYSYIYRCDILDKYRSEATCMVKLRQKRKI